MRIGKHEYKGVEVWYQDNIEQWECELEGAKNPIYGREKIEDVRKRIDRFLRVEKKFERFEAILLGRPRFQEEPFKIVTVTSQADAGEYWVSDAKKKRSRENTKCLALNTPENREVIQRVTDMQAKANTLREEASALRDSIAMEKDDE